MQIRNIMAVTLTIFFCFSAGIIIASSASIKGKVVETMNSAGYTYILLKNERNRTWVAVPETTVTIGQKIETNPGIVMRSFEIKGLGRTLESVIFSNGIKEDKKQNRTHSDSVRQAAAKFECKKASGKNGYRVADLFNKAQELDGKLIKLRGRVRKVSEDILDKNWVHIQDGSGDIEKKTHDILFITNQLPNKGDVILIKGTLHANRQFFVKGSHPYEAIVEDANISGFIVKYTEKDKKREINYPHCNKEDIGYRGEFENGKPHGKGVLQLANCDFYAGEFKSGLPHGGGMMVKFNHGKFNVLAISADFVGGVPKGVVVAYTDKHDYFLSGIVDEQGDLIDYKKITNRLTLMSYATKADRVMEYTHGNYVEHFSSGGSSRTGINQAAATADFIMTGVKEAVTNLKDCFTDPDCIQSVGEFEKNSLAPERNTDISGSSSIQHTNNQQKLKGVASIEESGNTGPMGQVYYKIKCNNGNTYRYYRHEGEWYNALGLAGFHSKSLKQLAGHRCR